MSQEENQSKLTRRDFLLASGSALASLHALGPASLGADDTFQYIVIGSGAGGGPVCANLAKAGKRVLLLEAGGGAENLKSRVPLFWGAATEDPVLSWSFFVKHNARGGEKNSKHVPGKGVLYPRSGTLGGCTAHNAMITMYPHNSDWDHLADVTGDKSWGHLAMRRYYERLEDARYLSPTDAKTRRRGKNGWLKLERNETNALARDPVLFEFVIAAAREAGLAPATIERIAGSTEEQMKKLLAHDPNDWDEVSQGYEGLVATPRATFQGRRGGTRALILDTQRRFPKNLEIRTHALVTKLVFKTGTNEVAGVEYLDGSGIYEADPRSTEAKRKRAVSQGRRKVARLAEGGEVILAGGAYNSPQVLMLSGIGPKEELERHRIPMRVRLEGVGKNLQDRYEVGVITKLKKPTPLLKGCTFGQPKDPCLKAWGKDSENSIYGSNGVVLGIKKRSRAANTNPDLFLFAVPGYFHGYYPKWSTDLLKPDHMSWVVLKGHTKNTAGSVTLKSSDPTAAPDINFRYFAEGNDSSGEDLDAVVEGVRYVRRLNAAANVKAHAVEEVFPGAVTHSERDVREFVQREAFGHHASCSNKMGSKNDPMAVVDGDFRVHGVKNLRIVDASVFSKIPGLFIVLPTYMIAEKASDAILRDA